MATNDIRYYAQQRECIDYFREEYQFLSNFYPARFTFDGVSYDNSEAAFQAQKCIDPAQRAEFSHLYATVAKRKGRKVALRPDWEQVKLPLMEKILYAKFSQNPVLAQRLLDTGDTPLKEGNNWHDYYWGVDLETGEGENHLGILLMELRSRFRQEGIPDLPTAPVRRFGPVDGITVTDEDITQLAVDCIVNAADPTLLGGGGVDGAIHREAGPGLLEECRTLGGCRPGEAKLTGGYRLKAKHIIHTVGPVHGKDDDSLLGVCYLNCMELARQNGLHSIAFPAISTGRWRFSFPKIKATHIAVTALREWKAAHSDYPMEILLSCMDYRIFELACEELEEK